MFNLKYRDTAILQFCPIQTVHKHNNDDNGAMLTMSAITTPGQLQVIKRTGDVAAFDAEKISVAIGKAFLAVEGQQSADSSRIHDRIEQLTEMVMNTFNRRLPSGGTIHI